MPGLFIRYDSSDTGARQNGTPIPAGTVWWLSPDVRLCRGLTATDTAIINVDHKIRVLVRNTAATPLANVHVEVWPCRFGTVPMPLPSFPPAAYDRTSCRVLPNPSQWDAGPCDDIGNAVTQPCTVPASGAAWFETNWQPLQDDIDWLWGGVTGKTEAHLCLLANCYADPPEGAALTRNAAGGILDHDVVNNAHHAQHNITVAQTRVGGWKLKIWAANTGGVGDTFVLQAREVPIRRLPDRIRLQNFDLLERITAGTAGAPGLNRVPALSRRLTDMGGLLRRLPVGPIVRDISLDVEGRRGSDLRVPLEAGEAKAVDLDLNVARPGWSRVDVVQRSAEGAVIGGVRVILLGLSRRMADEIAEISVFQ